MKKMSTWIRSRIADNLFIIGSPLIALLVIAVFCKTQAQSGYFLLDPSSPPWLGIMAGLLTQTQPRKPGGLPEISFTVHDRAHFSSHFDVGLITHLRDHGLHRPILG